MTGKQRAYLRGLANTIPARYQIGKNGIDYNLLTLLRDALEKNELIKIHVLENSEETPRSACERLCETLEAEPVQVIGGKFVIYKESKDFKTIKLPK